MEILNEEKKGNDKPEGGTTPQPQTGSLGRLIILGGKIILGIMLTGWILTAIALVVGCVALIAVGDIWAEYVALPLEGISPVVFAGLVCAVVVLFMGIVADIGFRLIAGRKIDLRKLVVAGVVWFIFFLWLIFATVRNADNWVIWAQESEAKIEQWERDFDEWEENLEERLESAIFCPTLIDGGDTQLTFYLYDLGDEAKLDRLCEEFDELYRYDDYILGLLIDRQEVVIDVNMALKDNTITRTTTITTPSGVTTVKVQVDKQTGNCINYKINP